MRAMSALPIMDRPATPLRILLADDHVTVRHGLRLLIDSQADMLVVSEASDGQAAIQNAIDRAQTTQTAVSESHTSNSPPAVEPTKPPSNTPGCNCSTATFARPSTAASASC